MEKDKPPGRIKATAQQGWLNLKVAFQMTLNESKRFSSPVI